MLEVARPARLLRQEPRPARRRLRRRRGRDRQPAGPQRRRAARPRSRPIMGLVDGARLGRASRARRSLGRKAFEIAHLRHRLRAGEPRHLPQAHGAPEPAARREARAAKRGAGRSTTCTSMFPRLKERAAHRGRRALGRRAADADPVPHADGRPRPDHDRRADRRPGAEDRRAGRRVPAASSSARGVSVLLVEQKLTIALDLRALLRDGPRPASSSRARRPTCAPTPTSARSGWRSERVGSASLSSAGRRHTWSPVAAETTPARAAAPRIERPFYFCNRRRRRTSRGPRMSANYEVRGDVAVITLNNPPVNGLGYATRAGHRRRPRQGAGRCRPSRRSSSPAPARRSPAAPTSASSARRRRLAEPNLLTRDPGARGSRPSRWSPRSTACAWAAASSWRSAATTASPRPARRSRCPK